MTAWGFLLLQWAKFNWILARVRSKVRRSFPQRKAGGVVLFSSSQPSSDKKNVLTAASTSTSRRISSFFIFLCGVWGQMQQSLPQLKGCRQLPQLKTVWIGAFQRGFFTLDSWFMSDWSLLTCFGKKKTWAVSLPFPTIYFSLMHTWFRRANIFCLILSDSSGAHTQ